MHLNSISMSRLSILKQHLKLIRLKMLALPFPDHSTNYDSHAHTNYTKIVPNFTYWPCIEKLNRVKVSVDYHGSCLVFSIKSRSNKNNTPTNSICSNTKANLREKADRRARNRFKSKTINQKQNPQIKWKGNLSKLGK